MNPTSSPSFCKLLSRGLATSAMAVVLGIALVACGGGTTGSSNADNKDATAAQSSSGQSAASVQAELSKGASLSAAELAAAEKAAEAADASGSAVALEEVKEGQTVPKSAYTSGEVARKAIAVRIPAWRFSNSSTGAHFYTTSASERDNIVNKLSPPFSYEGVAFSVASGFSQGLSAVHRFYNTQTGVHFYTISEAERANVVANMPQFSYEGVAYYASLVAGSGLIPFYRFHVPSKGFHFYTANEAEKDSIIANLSATYSYEGVGYYVLGTTWTAERLPHTGVSDTVCYSINDDVVPCSAALNMNPQQDGHRAAVNPMSYSVVGSNPKTSCVKDNVTGLIWEGKTDDAGLRDKDNTYTNLDNGQSTDASGYVAAVNAAKLCGYSDWRLPTLGELHGIVNYGLGGQGGSVWIDPIWFPNTPSVAYWSREGLVNNSGSAWVWDFYFGQTEGKDRSSAQAVRLVRGISPSGPRFTYSTLTYGSDAANNVVNDVWTGLQWRRCEEGRTWSGSACTGYATTFTHHEALAHARDQSGWRLPNIKEAASLLDLSVTGWYQIDKTAFPGPAGHVWSSTPYSQIIAKSVILDGQIFGSLRSGLVAVRLVRISQ